MSEPNSTLTNLKKFYRKIDIIIPQAYYINEHGVVGGEIEPAILKFATQHAMKIMPLITNTQFNSEKVHHFLSDVNAQSIALKSIIDRCRLNNFYGVQLDFEMVRIEDRTALTSFYDYAAKEFHKNGFVVSFAVAPVVSDKGESFFLKKIYDNWEGAYDLKRLGELADFITIMAYNQHGGVTTPGTTASYAWIDQAIKYALQYVPAKKISIGIPGYSTYWYTGTNSGELSGKVSVRMRGLNHRKAMEIVHGHKADLHWDNHAKVHYTIFSHDWLNEYLFIEDRLSFKFKYGLVNKYKLHGISVFDLGTEDPLIWKVL